MIQKDYIMRMIEQMAKALVKILLNKEAGHQEEAIKEVENAFMKTIGIDSVLLFSWTLFRLVILQKS